MPTALAPIPLETPIVEKDGAITEFFRLRWEELILGATTTPIAGTGYSTSGRTAALATTSVLTVQNAGFYRISYYLRKTVADGVSSSAQVTFGWTEHGSALTETDAALTTDSTSANKSGRKEVYADANSDLTIAVAYASNTPATMTWRLEVRVEKFAG